MLEARYASRAGLATALERLTYDPVWSPTESSPFVGYLDGGQRIGFRVWLEGINRDSDTPVTTSTGRTLTKGQAALRVVALVNGQEIAAGFGGAEQTQILVKPEVRFEHNLFLNVAASDELDIEHTAFPLSLPQADVVRYLSYDSEGSILPFTSGGTPPADNRRASVRTLGNVHLGNAAVFGKLVLPTARTIKPSGGSVLDSEERLDEAHIPYRFAAPDGADPAMPNTVISGAVSLAPGIYGDLDVLPGATVRLRRGAEYTFLGKGGILSVESGGRLELEGPVSDGPCVVYLHSVSAQPGSVVNMPATAGEAPKPVELQIYQVPWVDCSIQDFVVGRGGLSGCWSARGCSGRIDAVGAPSL